jgi:hypothetical protein
VGVWDELAYRVSGVVHRASLVVERSFIDDSKGFGVTKSEVITLIPVGYEMFLTAGHGAFRVIRPHVGRMYRRGCSGSQAAPSLRNLSNLEAATCV